MVRARKPAAVSGPGKLSRRTDLTPAQQPVREVSGQPYGDRKASAQAQAAAPMRAAPSPGGGGAGAAGGPPQAPPGMINGAFGPTRRPNEPITAGVPVGPGAGPDPRMVRNDPDMLLKAIYSRYPHPDLLRLISRRQGG